MSWSWSFKIIMKKKDANDAKTKIRKSYRLQISVHHPNDVLCEHFKWKHVLFWAQLLHWPLWPLLSVVLLVTYSKVVWAVPGRFMFTGTEAVLFMDSVLWRAAAFHCFIIMWLEEQTWTRKKKKNKSLFFSTKPSLACCVGRSAE